MTDFKMYPPDRLYERILPYAAEIRDADYDPEIDESPEFPVWYVHVYTRDGFCIHDTNEPFELNNEDFMSFAKLGIKTEKISDHITTYLYSDENTPMNDWNGYSDRLLKLFNLLDPSKEV